MATVSKDPLTSATSAKVNHFTMHDMPVAKYEENKNRDCELECYFSVNFFFFLRIGYFAGPGKIDTNAILLVNIKCFFLELSIYYI